MTGLIKKRPWWLIVLLALSISGCLKAVPGQAGAGDKLRVLIMKGAAGLEIKGSNAGSLSIKRAGDNAAVNGRARALPLRLYPQGDYVYINGRPYRGVVEVLGGTDGLMVINELNLEAYLVGIINNEISSRWPRDVIKTQAVVARTYAVYNRSRRAESPYHIDSSVLGQVYSGAAPEDPASLAAVRETYGEILSYGGEPALTVYHSNAGGMTESSREVWSRDYPYLVPVESPYDADAPRFSWDFSLSEDTLGELLRKAGYRMEAPVELKTMETTPSGRVRAIAVSGAFNRTAVLSGEDLRKIIGYSILRSTLFEVRKEGRVFTFKGKGSGHGVGLSQWGAKGMAEKGYSYREILDHFYPGTELVKAY